MSNYRDYISEKDYRLMAGTSWPSYSDFINNVEVTDTKIAEELKSFIATMIEKQRNIRIGDGTILAEENQQRQQQNFFVKTVHARSCTVPWETLGINTNGEAFICQSPSWVPKFVGNILKEDDIYNVLNSDIAKEIRREILANRYYYCNHKICGFFSTMPETQFTLHKNQQEPTMQEFHKKLLTVNRIPTNLIFDFDYTCNFKCPSCRTELINWNNDYLRRPINNKVVEKIKNLIIDKIETQPISIRWAGGEPFISEVYLDLLEYIIATGKTNIKHIIQTNGSYLKSKVVEQLLPNISELRISFDAGTPETYAKTRVNGNWFKLLDNVQYIKNLISVTGAATKLTADFVVQKDNYKDIPKFFFICDKLGITNINLQKMWNWGTWDQETFDENNIWNPDHLEYTQLQEQFNLVNRTS